jgi:hypothetical protein
LETTPHWTSKDLAFTRDQQQRSYQFAKNRAATTDAAWTDFAITMLDITPVAKHGIHPKVAGCKITSLLKAKGLKAPHP